MRLDHPQENALTMPKEGFAPFASLFSSSRLSDGDTQIAEFTAASASFALSDGRSVEIILDALPALSKNYGLHLSLSLSAWVCEDDSATELFIQKLPAPLSLSACASPSPLTHIFEAQPGLLRRVADRCPEFADVLAKRHALAEAAALAKSSPKSPRQKSKSSPRM